MAETFYDLDTPKYVASLSLIVKADKALSQYTPYLLAKSASNSTIRSLEPMVPKFMVPYIHWADKAVIPSVTSSVEAATELGSDAYWAVDILERSLPDELLDECEPVPYDASFAQILRVIYLLRAIFTYSVNGFRKFEENRPWLHNVVASVISTKDAGIARLEVASDKLQETVEGLQEMVEKLPGAETVLHTYNEALEIALEDSSWGDKVAKMSEKLKIGGQA